MQLSLKSDIENDAPLSHVASTKLNICAVLSSLKRHTEALKLAQEAVDHVKNTIDDLEDPEKRDQYINVDHSSLLNTISIASFNQGAEHEHLNQLHEALDAYRMALEYSKRCNIETL